MPMMAHKEHGFHHATGIEMERMLGEGWALCDDVMKYKREVLGIGVVYNQDNGAIPVEPEKEAEAGAAPKRGRPRKVW